MILNKLIMAEITQRKLIFWWYLNYYEINVQNIPLTVLWLKPSCLCIPWTVLWREPSCLCIPWTVLWRERLCLEYSLVSVVTGSFLFRIFPDRRCGGTFPYTIFPDRVVTGTFLFRIFPGRVVTGTNGRVPALRLFYEYCGPFTCGGAHDVLHNTWWVPPHIMSSSTMRPTAYDVPPQWCVTLHGKCPTCGMWCVPRHVICASPHVIWNSFMWMCPSVRCPTASDVHTTLIKQAKCV